MKYEHVGTTPTALANGQPVAPGDKVDLSKREVAANAHLIDAGVIVPVSEDTGKRSPAKAPSTDEEEGADA